MHDVNLKTGKGVDNNVIKLFACYSLFIKQFKTGTCIYTVTQKKGF